MTTTLTVCLTRSMLVVRASYLITRLHFRLQGYILQLELVNLCFIIISSRPMSLFVPMKLFDQLNDNSIAQKRYRNRTCYCHPVQHLNQIFSLSWFKYIPKCNNNQLQRKMGIIHFTVNSDVFKKEHYFGLCQILFSQDCCNR